MQEGHLAEPLLGDTNAKGLGILKINKKGHKEISKTASLENQTQQLVALLQTSDQLECLY